MDRIDELLLDWFEWNQNYSPALGYGKAEPACRDFRISRQWMDYDDLNAEVEWNIKESVGKVIEPLIHALETRYRVAINTAMRNFQSEYAVWTNPRYPDAQADDYSQAKAILCPKLVALGMIDKNSCKPGNFDLAYPTVVSSLA
jgi:hypothetical protein